MSPSLNRTPCSATRHFGVRRIRNSRDIAKCLNSSCCAFSMIARACSSCSIEMRCWYQLIASHSSWSDVIIRAKVRVSASSSSGGSWYCSVGTDCSSRGILRGDSGERCAMKLEGIHHITCITGDAPRNLDFYTRVLGLRLVKKTVNQDDPTVYHLFYADEAGSPGADLTFCEYPGASPGRAGAGMVHRITWRIRKQQALEFWEERL